MVSRRSFLSAVTLSAPLLGGCSGRTSPTTVCEVSALNWDRERHRIQVEIGDGDRQLWSRSATVPGRTDDVIPGPTWDQGLPDSNTTYAVSVRIDGGKPSSATLGEDGSSVEIHGHANEDGDPEIWSAVECLSKTTDA